MAFVNVKFENFFDRDRVIRATDQRDRRALSGAGAWGRRYVQRSMRPGRKTKWRNEVVGSGSGIYVDDRGRYRHRDGRFVSKADQVRLGLGGERSERRVFTGGSKPGEPPRYHDKLLRRLVLFQYNAGSKSVDIGPKLLKVGKPGSGEKFSGASTVPELLEKGGTKTVKRKSRKGRHGGRISADRVKLVYRPRPYIAPATPKVAQKLADLMKSTPLKA